MEKTMFDFWRRETAIVQKLLIKIGDYSNYNILVNDNNHYLPISFMISEEEAERLKSTPCEQPQSESVFDHAAINNRIREIEAEKEAKEQQTRHYQNLETIAFEHKNRMELESLFYTKSFDKKALDDLESILATPTDFDKLLFKKEDFLEDQKRKATFWCHQQAALLSNIQLHTTHGTSFKDLVSYLFKTFFPDLQQA